MLKILKRYPLSLVVILAVIYFSFFTPPKTRLAEIPFYDKWGHAAMYLGLSGIIWFEYLRRQKGVIRFWKVTPITILFPVLFGGAVELGQHYLTANRQGDWLDFAANSVGVLVASLIGYFILRPLLHRYYQR